MKLEKTINGFYLLTITLTILPAIGFAAQSQSSVIKSGVLKVDARSCHTDLKRASATTFECQLPWNDSNSNSIQAITQGDQHRSVFGTCVVEIKPNGQNYVLSLTSDVLKRRHFQKNEALNCLAKAIEVDQINQTKLSFTFRSAPQ